jgi:peptidoglycan/LPS O-acetylase OafA/YrhL
MRIAPLQYLGKISYGVYLLHPLAYWIMLELIKKRFLHFHKDDPLWFVETVGISLALAAVSWEFFETPFLQLKDRFTNNRAKRPLAVELQRTGTSG